MVNATHTDAVYFDRHDFRQVVRQAFPERSDLGGLRAEGTLIQVWEACSRFLGIDTQTLATRLAPVYDVPLAGALSQVQPDALALTPASFCQTHGVLPLRLENGAVVMATADPSDENVRERARFLVGRPIQWALAPPQDIEDAAYLAIAMEAQRQSAEGTPVAALDDNAVVRLARALMAQAIDARASDLHVQPFLGAFAVRIRVDGHLRRLTMLSDLVATSVIRHVKARSGMDPTNQQAPQDGRMNLVHGDREFDLRVSSLPASRGERLVLRFLDQSRVHSLSAAGFSLAALQVMRRATQRPSGLLVMTGPTGCGKTSTLYGMLAELNRASVNIITVENPVEYRIAGISQVDVNDKAGRSFATALRTILRQDPDVVLIGEIRDSETAEIATQAALTGHLVLSTLHTNDAMTSIPRLLDLGVRPSILADSLSVLIAQRLCRHLCTACRVPVVEPLTPGERAFLDITRNRPAYRPVGCNACAFTGYLGRLPVVEVVEMNRRLRDAVAQGESRLEVLEGLREGGLKSLAVSGSLRVISGDTTVAEVMSVVGPGLWRELAQHYGRDTDLADFLAEDQTLEAGQGVLMIGEDDAVAEQVGAVLQPEGLRLVRVRSAEEAHDVLARDETLAYIVGDLPDGCGLQDAADRLALNRLHISWARLPAAVLTPAALEAQTSVLRASGVMGAFVAKSRLATELLQFLRRARAR